MTDRSSIKKQKFKPMKNLIYIIVAMLIVACGGNKTQETTEAPEETVVETTEKMVVPTNKNIECFGTIDVPPSAIYEVYAKAEGFITKLSLLEGEQVQKGQVLAEIESPEFAQWQKELLSAKANYNWQKQHFDRNKQLYDNKAISDKEFQQIEKDYLLAKSTYQGWKDQLAAIGFSENQLFNQDNIKLSIKSPIHGKVVAIHIKNGSKVSADKHLFTIVDRTHLHVEISLAAADADKVTENQSFFMLHQNDTIRGHIYLINGMINDNNTIKIHGHFDSEKDEEKLMIGKKVFVEVENK